VVWSVNCDWEKEDWFWVVLCLSPVVCPLPYPLPSLLSWRARKSLSQLLRDFFGGKIMTNFTELCRFFTTGPCSISEYRNFRCTGNDRAGVISLSRIRTKTLDFFFCLLLLELWETNRRLIYECQCDERLKVTTERSTHLGYTGFHGGLLHLMIWTMLWC
jgi:hypothetical protein